MAIGLVWIYMGIVPKLMFPETGEKEMMRGSGLFFGHESTWLALVGVVEVLFGIAVIVVRKKFLHILNIIGLLCLAVGAGMGKPEVYTQPFNPFAITIPMIALSLLAMRHAKS